MEEFCYEGGIIDFVKFLNDGKEVPEGFYEPIYIEGKSDPDAPVTKMGEVEVSPQECRLWRERRVVCQRHLHPEGGMHLEWFPHRPHPRDQRLRPCCELGHDSGRQPER